ncbi:MAG: hypothetical protein LBC28_02190, partial [Oscillospiraceae bacterium]|nr:hypothetical protein [Oscillospiraceae bacterium]
KALPFKPSITSPRRGIAGMSRAELDSAVKAAIMADGKRTAELGLPEARYDGESKQAYLEYPNGLIR